MRADMAKVVTERPRRGHGLPSLKTGVRLNTTEIHAMTDDEDGGDRDGTQFSSIGSGSGLKSGMKAKRNGRNLGVTRAKASQGGQYGWDSKEFSDLLGPLRKYLRKQVGRPWNTIYSELSATLDKRSLSGRHIWGHILSDIEVHCYMGIDGKVYSRKPYQSWPVDGLFVHPTTGLVCWAKKTRFRYVAPLDLTVVDLADGRKLRQISGIWYEATYVKSETPYLARWTAFREGSHHRYYREAGTNVEYVLMHKRQLSSRELKTYGVQNHRAA